MNCKKNATFCCVHAATMHSDDLELRQHQVGRKCDYRENRCKAKIASNERLGKLAAHVVVNQCILCRCSKRGSCCCDSCCRCSMSAKQRLNLSGCTWYEGRCCPATKEYHCNGYKNCWQEMRTLSRHRSVQASSRLSSKI